ncbi:hypothetical protein LPJ70_005241 [Coemansia sp. RSA 2708]|nr:hypothetical protein LPJ70_005241 [Coemansia sp. RSA 2708]
MAKTSRKPEGKRKRECAAEASKSPTKPASPPAKALRRTQSAVLPQKTASRNSNSHTDGALGLLSDSDSDLPDVLSLLKTPESKPKANAKGQRRRRKLVKSASDVARVNTTDDSDGEPGAVGLKIPGELVLAYGLRKYYPARVLAQPSPNRYLVEFFDGTHSTLSRARILTMYERGFYSCSLGAFRLVGDEPVSNSRRRIDSTDKQAVDSEMDFERESGIFHKLVADMEAIRGDLDALHKCPLHKIEDMADVEDRMPAFFGEDATAKRLLPSRVNKGFLNRAEFDFLGRLLSKWYETPPLALVSAKAPAAQVVETVVIDSTDADPDSGSSGDADPDSNAGAASPASEISQLTEPIDQIDLADPEPGCPSSSVFCARTVEFIHEVLLPHAVKRLTMARDGCTLAESEVRMAQASEAHWADQILAARGVSQEDLA